jgi:hypothetical protein
MVVGGLIAVGTGWIAVFTVLLLDLLGMRRLRSAGHRWAGYGFLLSTSGVFVDSIADVRGWPQSQVHDLHAAMLLVVLAGLVVLVTGLAIQARASARSRRGG